ncbi:MAG: polysaccharide export protein [Acidobacteriota bacterium]|nr:MAG: polysaccharide export protein [Acidobacteriota bacterium]
MSKNNNMTGGLRRLVDGFAAMLTLVFTLSLAPGGLVQAQTPASAAKPESASAGDQTLAEEEEMIGKIFRQFHSTYRIGPADEIAIRIKGQPDYSLDKVKVSPVGSIYHSLIGEVSIAGMTIDQVKKQLTEEFSEYLIDPQVSVELIEAQSAKVGVIGEVARPGILVLTRPMTVLDVISEAGGILDTGKKSEVVVLRQDLLGNKTPIKVNLKRVIEGKATPEENIAIQAGDTVIVDGNLKKRMAAISAVTGFANLITFIALGGR